MTTLYLFQMSLFVATLLCALVAGLVLGFAVVIMPGITKLPDMDFLRAFKVIDGVIQDNQPIFMLVWVGSIIAIIVTLVLGIGHLQGLDWYLLLVAALTYLLGVQLPTFRFNIPLNNRLQSLDLSGLNDSELEHTRDAFEPDWNRWNGFRTVAACSSAALLLVLVFRL